MGSTPIEARRGAQFFLDDVDPSACYECGEDPDVVHHIAYTPEERTVPLCYSCHGEIHADEEHPLHPGEKRRIGGESGTQSVTATLPRQTLRWLRDTYTDATSDSARVAMAISDARLVRDEQ